jgi:hypothetical protein
MKATLNNSIVRLVALVAATASVAALLGNGGWH